MYLQNLLSQNRLLAEAGYTKPVIKVGNLKSLRTIADVRDAVKAYFMLLTINPISSEYIILAALSV